VASRTAWAILAAGNSALAKLTRRYFLHSANGEHVSFISGRALCAVIASVFAAILIYNTRFKAAVAARAASSQVVYAPISSPLQISGTGSEIDFPLLLLEPAFVAFVGWRDMFCRRAERNATESSA